MHGSTRSDRSTSLLLAAFGLVLGFVLALWIGGALDPAAETNATAPRPQGERAASHGVGPAPGERVDANQPDRVAVADAAGDRVRIRGRVVDVAGAPLAQAWVGDLDDARPEPVAADGSFILALPRAAGTVRVLAVAPGKAPSQVPCDVAGGEADLGDIVLAAGASIRGRVLANEDGRPLANVSVTAELLASGGWPDVADMNDWLEPLHTDADGHFACAELVAGAWRVHAAAAGRVPLRSGVVRLEAGGDHDCGDLSLAVGQPVVGTVEDADGLALAGATVRIRSGRGAPWFDGSFVTGADGSFTVDALPAGPLRVEIGHPGHLRFARDDFDPAAEPAPTFRLRDGLRIEGLVVRADTGEPVEEFAVWATRVGAVDPTSNGSMDQQVERRLAELREELAAARARGDQPPAGAEPLLEDLTARLRRLAAELDALPVREPADLEAPSRHATGSFTVDGLEAGRYEIGVAAAGFRLAIARAVDLEIDAPAAELRFDLRPGLRLAGSRVDPASGSAVAGGRIELVRIDEDALRRGNLQRANLQPDDPGPFDFVFERAAPEGIVVATAVPDSEGRFAFEHLAPGRYFVTSRHPRYADHDSRPVQLPGFDDPLRLAVERRATLTGTVRGVPAQPSGAGVEVVILGGHGTQRTVRTDAGQRFRVDDLQPGSYLVRAYPADATQYVRRFTATLFPLHFGAIDADDVPPPDVRLVAGRTATFDPLLDVPKVGAARITMSLNGAPAPGARAVLRPLRAGDAPTGQFAVSGNADDRGMVALDDVPVGRYRLSLYGPTRQELHREDVEVHEGETCRVDAALQAGGLRGTVRSADGAALAGVRGSAWLLPGVAEAPSDLHAWRRELPVCRLRVVDGSFADAAVPVGPALLVVEVDGHARVTRAVTAMPAVEVSVEITLPGI